MSTFTKIQWADSTVNPIMGCGGCELFPAPNQILNDLDKQLAEQNPMWDKGRSRETFQTLFETSWAQIKTPSDRYARGVSTTNIYHLREHFGKKVGETLGAEAARTADKIIKTHISCYAAKQHLNRGSNMLAPDRAPIKGYADYFEKLTNFPGRLLEYVTEGRENTKNRDLLGTHDADMPWKNGLPRLIFVSDMGDAFSSSASFEYLQHDVMEAIRSSQGKKHLWLWLTKRPEKMTNFTDRFGSLPENVCAMTTLTGAGDDQLSRLRHLNTVDASCRGLSLEPLRESIPPDSLDLSGIDWVIVGGESGDKGFVTPFDVNWARDIRDHCRRHKVAFFMKQLGREPCSNGTSYDLKDSHGGDWDEWPEELADLKIREFPQYFHDYRKSEIPPGKPKPRRFERPEKKITLPPEQQQRFKELNAIVAKAAKSFVDAGYALMEIKEDKLYRADFGTFQAYCTHVHDISRQYANSLIRAGKNYKKLETIVSNSPDILEVLKTESRMRALGKIKDPETQIAVVEKLLDEHEKKAITADVIELAVSKHLNSQKGDSVSSKRRKTVSEMKNEALGILEDLETALMAGRDWEASLRLLKNLLGS